MQRRLSALSDETYDIVYADPPWFYYGSQSQRRRRRKALSADGARELAELPVRAIMNKRAVLFLVVDGPALEFRHRPHRERGVYTIAASRTFGSRRTARGTDSRAGRAADVHEADDRVRARSDDDADRPAVSDSRSRSRSGRDGTTRRAQPEAGDLPTDASKSSAVSARASSSSRANRPTGWDAWGAETGSSTS